MDIQDLLDTQAIHEASMRYARGVDRESVGPGLVELMAHVPVSMRHITNCSITLHGDDPSYGVLAPGAGP